MHCWKSINLNKQYGLHKIFILSLLTMLISFITIYTFLSFALKEDGLRDDYIVLFMSTIFLLYPVHKVLHLIPLLPAAKKLTIYPKQNRFFPSFSVKVKDPISKRLFLIALLTPFVIISGSMLILTVLYPAYIHYFTIILSLHIGLCVSDFITLKNVLNSPQNCYVEEHEDGIEILISKY